MGDSKRALWSAALAPTRVLVRIVRDGLRDRGWLASLANQLFALVVLAVGAIVALVYGAFFAYLIFTTQSSTLAVVCLVAAALLLRYFLRIAKSELLVGSAARWFWVSQLGWVAIIASMGLGVFVGLSAWILDAGNGTVKPAIPEGEHLSAAYEHYLWHLADSVPFLKVPATLNWKPEYAITDGTNGALTLTYKLLVLVPLLALVQVAISRWSDEPRTASTTGAADKASDGEPRGEVAPGQK